MRSKIIIAAGMLVTAVVLVAFRSPERTAEVRRIQAHFDSVLVELRARDVTSLTREQAARRSELLSTLSGYRNAGVFPKNYDFTAPTPYFVDRRTGTLCAVAYLLGSTGRRDIVDRVAAMNNNVWVPQLAGDAEFERWLSTHGLTLAEAARIQVPYVGDPPADPVQQRSSRFTPVGTASAGLAGATALGNALWNRDGAHRLGSAAGVATALVSIGYGAAKLGDPRADGSMIAVNLLTGAIGTVVSGRSLLHQRRTAQRRAEAARVAVAPLVPLDGTGAGLSLTMRF